MPWANTFVQITLGPSPAVGARSFGSHFLEAHTHFFSHRGSAETSDAVGCAVKDMTTLFSTISAHQVLEGRKSLSPPSGCGSQPVSPASCSGSWRSVSPGAAGGSGRRSPASHSARSSVSGGSGSSRAARPQLLHIRSHNLPEVIRYGCHRVSAISPWNSLVVLA